MNAVAKLPRVRFTGANSNAFNLLGLCRAAARKAGWNDKRVNEFVTEATAGDYDHLLHTCMKYFDVL